jgi:Rrf2 family protein
MRVELTRKGDYAVRAMVVLARPGIEQLTAADIAARSAIPPSYVAHVMGTLVRAGLVANRRGREGGYRLARPAADISLLAVIEAAEGDLQLRTCILRGGPCGRDGVHCDVHDAFARAQDAATSALAGASLAEVAGGRLSVPPAPTGRAPERTTAQLSALDEAVRGIGGVLDLDRVLQLIVDRVRGLVGAEYAAIGIVDAAGAIERFITSGIDAEQRARIGRLPRGRGLLGLIIRENRAYRIPDISRHPQRYGFPPHHPEMHSFLGMPIRAKGEVVGRLYLTNKRDAAEFSDDDQAMVERFALHAGIAIDNARLHDQVQRLAIVDERERISRDLHDSAIQAIYAQTLALDDVPQLMEEDPGEAARRVDAAIDALHAVIRDIRNFIFGLRPVLLEGGSVADGLRHLATELRRSGAVEVQVAVTDDAELPMETVAELLALTREALSNIARHASASKAVVRLESDADGVRLELADDGRGFDPALAGERGHHGLSNMRARAEAIGAGFEVDSQAGGGTRIIVTVPRGSRGTNGGEDDR